MNTTVSRSPVVAATLDTWTSHDSEPRGVSPSARTPGSAHRLHAQQHVRHYRRGAAHGFGPGPRRGVFDAAKRSGNCHGDRAAPRAGPGRGAAPPFGDAEVATMSATTSAATGRCFGIQRVCQVWERSRSALYARRARAHHHRLGAGAGAAGAAAEAIGRAAAGGDSDRSRSVPVPRRRPSQGPRPASDPGRDPRRPHAGAARHADARTALPAPRASGRREDPRREGHHPGAQRDVGDGRRAGIHARRRVGLDLRGSRTLERGRSLPREWPEARSAVAVSNSTVSTPVFSWNW